MTSEIYRDSLSAWKALMCIGGLEINGRDKDLVEIIKKQLKPSAPDLETALRDTSIDQLLSALFLSIQPFVSMFKDILSFFENSNATEGKEQLRLSVGDEFLDLKHFEEFLEHWESLGELIDVPALGRSDAFLLFTLRRDFGGNDFLIEGFERGEPPNTGLGDVDNWLREYDADCYAPFPSSIMPKHFPAGLSDAAALVQAAVSLVRQRGLTRTRMIKELRDANNKSAAEDALHPCAIAQNETDIWLRTHVGLLANIRKLPEDDLRKFASVASKEFSRFPRRSIPGIIEIKQLERILSLPVWKKRYETYGVWIATQIVGALPDHEVVINGDNGELKFAFKEAKIADVRTSIPEYSLYAEKRVSLDNPDGKTRKKAVQPDFSVWENGADTQNCVLVVEVKHYKKRSRGNFRDALIDYSRAHPHADVILVNYGPVGKDFTDLPMEIADRCRMIGPLTPETKKTLSTFQDIVSSKIGKPVLNWRATGAAPEHEIIALDVSLSMKSILASSAVQDFFARISKPDATIAMIDQDVRKICEASEISRWISKNNFGYSTSLATPVEELLRQYSQIVVVTDEGGLLSLEPLNPERISSPLGEASNAIFVRVSRTK